MKNSRLHRNLVEAVVKVLQTTFGEGYHADKVIGRVLKSNKKWGARDRSFIAESSYEIVRWWRFLWELYGKSPALSTQEIYHLFGIWWRYHSHELPIWPEFEKVRHQKIVSEKLPASTGIQQSYPQWLDEQAHKELGDQWPSLAKALNQPANLIVRTNTLKTSRPKLQKTLAEENVNTQPLSLNEEGLVLDKHLNIFRKKSFQQGLYEVQDGGSQLITPFLDVQPGMRVIDACAGAGGKTLHLAALMQNKGNLIAMDTGQAKLQELKKRAKRNGVHNIETRFINSAKVTKRLKESADRLLLDVPCSGTGVIKRNPDTKWKLQPEHLEKLYKTQSQILCEYSKMLKPGGLLVYATCSILPSENEEQVNRFLTEHKNFNLREQKQIQPLPESDGFYRALLEKTT